MTTKPQYIITTRHLKTGIEDIKILKKAWYKHYGESVFTKEQFIEMYMDYTGCGRRQAERDFKKHSRKGSKSRWIVQVD